MHKMLSTSRTKAVPLSCSDCCISPSLPAQMRSAPRRCAGPKWADRRRYQLSARLVDRLLTYVIQLFSSSCESGSEMDGQSYSAVSDTSKCLLHCTRLLITEGEGV